MAIIDDLIITTKQFNMFKSMWEKQQQKNPFLFYLFINNTNSKRQLYMMNFDKQPLTIALLFPHFANRKLQKRKHVLNLRNWINLLNYPQLKAKSKAVRAEWPECCTISTALKTKQKSAKQKLKLQVVKNVLNPFSKSMYPIAIGLITDLSKV